MMQSTQWCRLALSAIYTRSAVLPCRLVTWNLEAKYPIHFNARGLGADLQGTLLLLVEG